MSTEQTVFGFEIMIMISKPRDSLISNQHIVNPAFVIGSNEYDGVFERWSNYEIKSGYVGENFKSLKGQPFGEVAAKPASRLQMESGEAACQR
ncbi:hypothetical protein EVAR_14018_1 [Eumeta japonica]|uniref:Uncharacterized protein n=1 Tax=Eumeta variegata TaxID=151549 RepID=A0A4C1X909_EUMVA|nr:hypothetical protein EVAR_14018_1 [Eumeta japonica]